MPLNSRKWLKRPEVMWFEWTCSAKGTSIKQAEAAAKIAFDKCNAVLVSIEPTVVYSTKGEPEKIYYALGVKNA